MTSAQIKAPVLVPQSSLLGQDLRHYIVRPGNIMIPLIPVDQLPFQLQGIPRQLNHQQMFEGGWKFIQETKESAKPLPIQAPTKVEPSQPKFLPPDYKVRAEAVEPLTTVVNIINPQNTTPWSSPSVAKPTFEESLPVRRIPTTMADRFMANQNPSNTNFVVDKWRQTQESNNARRLTPPAMADHQVVSRCHNEIYSTLLTITYSHCQRALPVSIQKTHNDTTTAFSPHRASSQTHRRKSSVPTGLRPANALSRLQAAATSTRCLQSINYVSWGLLHSLSGGKISLRSEPPRLGCSDALIKTMKRNLSQSLKHQPNVYSIPRTSASTREKIVIPSWVSPFSSIQR